MRLFHVHDIADCLFPSACVSCGKPVSFRSNGVCRTCDSALEPAVGGCVRCGAPSTASVCEICMDRTFFPAQSFIISEYTGVMKNIIRAVKFKADVGPVKYLAEKGRSFLLENEVFPDLITCVPMNRKKRKKRGYNQSELIARALADLTGIRFIILLNEKENTVSQKKLSFEERFINVLGRYYTVRPGRCTGKKILVVDDVFTTGATLNECSRLLLEAGASEITTLTFARADIKGLKIEGAVIS